MMAAAGPGPELVLPPIWGTAAAAAVGLCIGSFLNVVVRRVPRGESISFPGSHCACGAPIRWHENIPLLSFLWLRGRARCCGRPISWRYPALELATALLFVGCWLRHPVLPLALAGWVFLGSLLAAAIIDAGHFIIPEALTLGLGLAGIVLSLLIPALHPPTLAPSPDPFVLQSLRSGVAALTGTLVGSGLTLWIATLAEAVLRREAMGMGDVLFVGAIGAFCGWHGAVFAIFGGAVVGLFWVAVALAWRRGTTLTSRLPFGPMLAAAAAAYFLWLAPPVDAWFDQLASLFG